MAASSRYDEFVVVAEEEWKIRNDSNYHITAKFSTRIGNYEWHCTSNNYEISLQCQEMIEGIVKEMRIEVFVYFLQNNQYCRAKQNSSECTLLKGTNAKWSYSSSSYQQQILLAIRILKDRSQFPIFTAPNSARNFSSDVKLRVGEQFYFVNKQLLSLFSPVFDRMFNGDYKESKQDEIELKVEGLTNPKVFEDFWLFFRPPASQIKVLPNNQNVADLLVLAEYFQMDLLKKKCERHLTLCREMDIVERVLLAKKFGFKDLQAKLVKGCDTLEDCKRICMAALDAPEQ